MESDNWPIALAITTNSTKPNTYGAKFAWLLAQIWKPITFHSRQSQRKHRHSHQTRPWLARGTLRSARIARITLVLVCWAIVGCSQMSYSLQLRQKCPIAGCVDIAHTRTHTRIDTREHSKRSPTLRIRMQSVCCQCMRMGKTTNVTQSIKTLVLPAAATYAMDDGAAHHKRDYADCQVETVQAKCRRTDGHSSRILIQTRAFWRAAEMSKQHNWSACDF